MPPPPPQAGKYRCIVVDPPWETNKHPPISVRPNSRTEKPYEVLTLDGIQLLPVPEWGAEDCYIWIWTLSGKLKDGTPAIPAAVNLLLHWGFRYHTLITWDKTMGAPIFGPYRVTTEHAVFGWRGNFRLPKEHLAKMRTGYREAAPRGRHSTKPDSFYAEIAAHFPSPRLDVFARQPRTGFDTWGDEAPTQ